MNDQLAGICHSHPPKSLFSGRSSRTTEEDERRFDQDWDEPLEWVEEKINSFEGGEEPMAMKMIDDGDHPNKIVNTIKKQRYGSRASKSWRQRRDDALADEHLRRPADAATVAIARPEQGNHGHHYPKATDDYALQYTCQTP